MLFLIQWVILYLENCGKSNLNDRIVGGIPASQNEFPWIGIINMAKNVKVYFFCKINSTSINYFCPFFPYTSWIESEWHVVLRRKSNQPKMDFNSRSLSNRVNLQNSVKTHKFMNLCEFTEFLNLGFFTLIYALKKNPHIHTYLFFII